MFSGMGDDAVVEGRAGSATVRHAGLRVVRGLTGDERDLLLHCWQHLWQGTMSSQRQLKTLECRPDGDGLQWLIAPRTSR